MPVLARIRSVWKTLARKEQLDRELDEELRAAVETLAHRYVAQGLSPQAARRAALGALAGRGGLEQVRERVRESRIGAGLEMFLLDLRYAWRGLLKARGFTAVIVATLALGVGANTAIFSVVHAMLIESLPYRDADRLAFIWLDRGDVGYPRGPLSGPDLKDLREGSRTFAEFGGIWATGSVALTGSGDPEQLRGAFVTTNFFQVLGANAALGRTFRAEDSAPGAHPTVLLGWDLFQRRFGGDPSIVGRQILLNEESTTVIGVMPGTFRLLLPMESSVPDHLQVWVPFWHDLETGPRGNLFLRVVGRMLPGVTIAAARSDVASIAQAINRQHGTRRVFTTVALQDDDVRDIRGPLLALFAGVGILLMIACVNVASLLVARAASRVRETALRLALGASRAGWSGSRSSKACCSRCWAPERVCSQVAPACEPCSRLRRSRSAGWVPHGSRRLCWCSRWAYRSSGVCCSHLLRPSSCSRSIQGALCSPATATPAGSRAPADIVRGRRW